VEDREIKRGFDIYLYYWVFVFFIIFVLINYFANILKIETFDVGLMVSVVSFLFGFFISISYSMILSRIGSLKESLAVETGRLVSLFLLSKNLGKKFHESIKESIDKYTILTLRNYKDYNFGRDETYSIYDNSNLMELKTELQKQSASSFFYVLGEFETTREKLEYLTSGRLLKVMKITNYLLAMILISLLFLNRGGIVSNLLFIILSTIVAFILLIIEDYEDLRIGDYLNNISNSEQLFDLIGKDRYYPEFILGRVKLEEGRDYRIGFYNSKEKTDKIITLTYNRSFNFNLARMTNRIKENIPYFSKDNKKGL